MEQQTIKGVLDIFYIAGIHRLDANGSFQASL